MSDVLNVDIQDGDKMMEKLGTFSLTHWCSKSESLMEKPEHWLFFRKKWHILLMLNIQNTTFTLLSIWLKYLY